MELAVLTALDRQPVAGHRHQRRGGAAEVGVGDVKPRLIRGVQLCSSRAAFGESSSTLSPQLVAPLNGPLPVATRMRPLPGSITAPDRAQMAESLAGVRARRSSG